MPPKLFGLIELGQDHAVNLNRGESIDSGTQAAFAGDGAQDEVHLVGSRLEQKFRQLANLDFVARTATGGVNENEVDRAQLVKRPWHLRRVVDHGQRHVDDFGVGLELLDSRDPVSVDGDSPTRTP